MKCHILVKRQTTETMCWKFLASRSNTGSGVIQSTKMSEHARKDTVKSCRKPGGADLGDFVRTQLTQALIYLATSLVSFGHQHVRLIISAQSVWSDGLGSWAVNNAEVRLGYGFGPSALALTKCVGGGKVLKVLVVCKDVKRFAGTLYTKFWSPFLENLDNGKELFFTRS